MLLPAADLPAHPGPARQTSAVVSASACRSRACCTRTPRSSSWTTRSAPSTRTSARRSSSAPSRARSPARRACSSPTPCTSCRTSTRCAPSNGCPRLARLRLTLFLPASSGHHPRRRQHRRAGILRGPDRRGRRADAPDARLRQRRGGGGEAGGGGGRDRGCCGGRRQGAAEGGRPGQDDRQGRRQVGRAHDSGGAEHGCALLVPLAALLWPLPG